MLGTDRIKNRRRLKDSVKLMGNTLSLRTLRLKPLNCCGRDGLRWRGREAAVPLHGHESVPSRSDGFKSRRWFQKSAGFKKRFSGSCETSPRGPTGENGKPCYPHPPSAKSLVMKIVLRERSHGSARCSLPPRHASRPLDRLHTQCNIFRQQWFP